MFDVTVQCCAIEIEPADDHVKFALIVGLGLPTGQPGQAIQIPVGAVRVGMGRDSAIEHGARLLEAGQALPEEQPAAASGIVVANNLQGVDQAMAMDQKFRKG